MSPAEVRQAVVKQVVHPSRADLATHAVIIIAIIIGATILALHGDLSSGDVLAVYTAAITGTAGVAGARAGASANTPDRTEN